MSNGKMEQRSTGGTCSHAAVKQALHRTVFVKRTLSRNAKLSMYWSVYVPTLTYDHELWVVTERTRSRIQAAEMSFLHRVAGLSLRDRVRISGIRRELGVQSAEVVWASDSDTSFRGFPGKSNWKETPGKTQDTLEGLNLQTGLGTPRDRPEWAGKCCGWEGSLGQPAGSAAPVTRPRTKRMRMDAWMDHKQVS